MVFLKNNSFIFGYRIYCRQIADHQIIYLYLYSRYMSDTSLTLNGSGLVLDWFWIRSYPDISLT